MLVEAEITERYASTYAIKGEFVRTFAFAGVGSSHL